MKVSKFTKNFIRTATQQNKQMLISCAPGGLEIKRILKICPALVEGFSYGVTIDNPHSVHERTYISSINKVYALLKHFLETNFNN
jgi:di/tripeptidase